MLLQEVYGITHIFHKRGFGSSLVSNPRFYKNGLGIYVFEITRTFGKHCRGKSIGPHTILTRVPYRTASKVKHGVDYYMNGF